MKMPALGPETSLRISRQGGLVAAPALTRPRQIEFADCDPAQRRGLCSQIAEERAPKELLRLWQDGAIPDPPG